MKIRMRESTVRCGFRYNEGNVYNLGTEAAREMVAQGLAIYVGESPPAQKSGGKKDKKKPNAGSKDKKPGKVEKPAEDPGDQIPAND